MNTFKVGDKVQVISDYFTENGAPDLPKGKILFIEKENVIGREGWFIDKTYKAHNHIRLIPIIKTILPLP